MNIIIGLGNPGERYKLTRHNAGWLAVDALAEKLGLAWQTDKKASGELIRSGDIILYKPGAFMNNSGPAVRRLLSYYRLLPKKFGLLRRAGADLSGFLTVVHDDLDLLLGRYKVSADSRSAGHKGVQSVINELKTKNFRRVRIGIKTPRADLMPTEKFVLQKFSPNELTSLEKTISELVNFLSGK